MDKQVRAYVGAVFVSAICITCALAYLSPSVDLRLAAAPAVFALMGMIAQAISYSTKKSFTGSIAFLPFLASVVLYPSWVCALLVGIAVAVGEMRIKKSTMKRVFNVAQFVVSIGLSTTVYLSLGGVSVQVDDAFRLWPHAAAVVTFLVCNTVLVAGAVAISSSRSTIEVWINNNTATLAYDLIAIPVVYWCALFYTNMGWPGVAFGFVALGGAQQFYQKNRLLELAYEETLEILVGAVELRDPYTSGHSQRVRKYSQIIASALNLPSKQIERIGIAALLHDVGKIDGIFVPILQKPGKLTPEERATMELHPLKSADLVARASQLADIVETVRHHHENWDGTGYPSQLAGTSIPLGSRIIMFADTIDAMTTDRPYRKAMGPGDVRSELLKYRGSQFDPGICDVLIDSPEFQRIFDSKDSGRIQSLTQVFERIRGRQRASRVA